MMDARSETNTDASRRREILDAALAAFLQHGFAKTSLEDIARRAHLSRPLIYRKFKNKEQILAAVFDSLFVGRYERAAKVVAGRQSKREKLTQLCEVLYLEPWDEVTGTPMAVELYEACSYFDPEGFAKRERQALKFAQDVLGAKDLAEVFWLALDGVAADVPTTAVLRRRVNLLIERFT